MANTSSFIISKSIQSFGKWSCQKIAVKYEKICKKVEDVISRVVLKPQSTEVSNTVSENVVVKKSLNLFLKPPLQNYKTTITENAWRAQRQMFSIGLSPKNFFKKDFIWRRAAQGHLLAFAGLFLYQEEAKELQKRTNVQYHIYDEICMNIKTLFPEIKTAEIQPGKQFDLKDFKLGDATAIDASGVTYEACLEDMGASENECLSESFQFTSYSSKKSAMPSIGKSGLQQEYAIKAMFPVPGLKSCQQILKHSESELTCCGRGQFGNHDGQDGQWPRKKELPAHPNIVRYEQVFFDNFPPTPNGCPSSLSSPEPSDAPILFAVAQRYDTNLQRYLMENKPDDVTASLLILQLLESVAHLESHCFVHRDISSENVMLDFDADGFPHVVLAGFGQCFGGNRHDLLVPYEHERLDTRVGDPSAQAPEVSRSKARHGNVVDYRKSDAWMVGALAFEILTGMNPFRGQTQECSLDSRTYSEEDLPPMDDLQVSHVLKVVVKLLLTVDPAKRLSAREAADILHLQLFALPPNPDRNEDSLLSELRVWTVSHCAEAVIRRNNRGVLSNLCRSFFHRLEPVRLAKACRVWALMRA